MPEYRTIAQVADVPTNGSKLVVVDGRGLLVCNSRDEIHVVENRCSHQDQPLDGGRVRNGYIFCPVHGMRFKLDNGEAIGQLTRVPLCVFDSRVVDGKVQVRLDPPDS
ncbi:MAG: Rieske 2Fe-2S domain-containing protein [Gammaproteobacteria bacterium]|nr:Rieske 2Fe-2S domain-containing protein [Gammaproteobacteria bacterium]MDE0271873.1 Rieske 2Fe-2S domain-containing protein [Gammaproteobacteria bacterium]